MPADHTDNEQVEMIKKWWQDYGKSVSIVIIIGLSLGLGWRYWQQQQTQVRAQASVLYQQLLAADSQNQQDTVQHMADEMIKHYPKTEYASLANMFAAKALVKQNQNPLALQKLQWVMDHSHLTSLQEIARIKASRLLISQKKLGEALNLISTVNDAAFQPFIDEVKGDIYFAQGANDKASQAYSSAQTGMAAIIGPDLLLSMKLAQPLTKTP